jgi:hypothetical protein
VGTPKSPEGDLMQRAQMLLSPFRVPGVKAGNAARSSYTDVLNARIAVFGTSFGPNCFIR